MDHIFQKCTTTFDNLCVLIRRTWYKLDAMSGKEGCGADRFRDATFAVHNQLTHGAMNGQPCLIDGIHERGLTSILDYGGCMPARAAIDKVNDTLLFNEDNVTFHLLIELVGNVHRGDTVRERLHPLPADCTRVDDIRDHRDDFTRQACTL
jgi:hypothetical protein